MKRKYKYMLTFTIAVYTYLLLSIILFKYMSPMEIFKTSRPIYNGVNFKLFYKLYNSGLSLKLNAINILGNIGLFIPFGILMSMKNEKSFRNIFYGLMLSLFFEGMQYYFEIGSFDVNDILLNVIGVVLGVIIYKIIRVLFKKRIAHQFITSIGFYTAIISVVVGLTNKIIN